MEQHQTQSRGQRPPVIIIGAHRSGTTATARALRMLGLQIGQLLDSHDEPRALRQLHDQYLRKVGASWYDPLPFLNQIRTAEGQTDCVKYLRENVHGKICRILGYNRTLRGLFLYRRIKRGTPWGWKEPRTTLFAPCWLDLFPDARILHLVRHPLAVARSMQHRELKFQNKGDAPSGRVQELSYCLELAAIYMEAGERVEQRARYYHRIRFEDVQADPVKSLALLVDFCELSFTQKQLAEAAGTIRMDVAQWPPTGSDVSEHVANSPVFARMGYELPRKS